MLFAFLEMSLAGGCLVLVIIVLRALLLHRLPKELFFWLWMLALLRLLLPVFPTSPLSVFARWEAPAALRTAADAAPWAAREGAGIASAALEAPLAANARSAPVARPASEAALTPALTLVWLAVALLLLLLLGLAYARGLRRFQRAEPMNDPFIRAWLKQNALRRPVEVRASAGMDSPMTYGVLRPVILLPKGIDKGDAGALLCALDHELSHIRHFDAVWKLIIAAAACLHWFNPLVWAMAILANRDIELCCDARVLRRGGEEERRAYASALVRMEEARARALPLASAFSRNALEERIGAIMNVKKRSVVALLTALLITAVSLAAFAAAPASETTSQAVGAAYEAFGLRREEDGLAYCSVSVRLFADDAAGIASLDPRGNIDVYAVRDGSGSLTGLRVSTAEEFAEATNALEAELREIYASAEEANAAYLAEWEWYASADPAWPDVQTDDEVWVDDPNTAYGDINIAENGYADFGMTTHQGLLLYNGEYVRYLDDAGGGVRYENDGGAVDLYAERDANGALTGFREASEEEYDANTKRYKVW